MIFQINPLVAMGVLASTAATDRLMCSSMPLSPADGACGPRTGAPSGIFCPPLQSSAIRKTPSTFYLRPWVRGLAHSPQSHGWGAVVPEMRWSAIIRHEGEGL